jgi:ABC-type sugar transport system ATPase subunit
MTVRDNLVATTLGKLTNAFGILQKKRMSENARQAVYAYRIATPSTERMVLNLSGGNQQKCLIAQWMAIDPHVLLLDEPTRGVDIGARAEIYHLLRETAAAGAAVLLISSELPELIGMCDRILVMCQGRIAGEVARAEFSEERILAYAAGVEQGAPVSQHG